MRSPAVVATGDAVASSEPDEAGTPHMVPDGPFLCCLGRIDGRLRRRLAGLMVEALERSGI